MPSAVDHQDDLWMAIKQISQSSMGSDYIDQLIPIMKDARYSNQLQSAFDQFSNDREAEIERICNANHQDFVSSVDSMLRIRDQTVQMSGDILELNESIQESIEKLAEQKKALVDSRGVRQNINEATQALNACLNVLRIANNVQDMLREKNYYGALRALDELQTVHLKAIDRYKIADMIEKSVPQTQDQIREAVKTDLSTWLFRIRESSQFLGEVSFYYTDVRRTRNQNRAEADPRFSKFKLNSAIELVADETDEFDVLNNEEAGNETDFSPLFEAMHINETLGKSDQFRTEYAADRRTQKDLIIPTKLNLLDEECGDLSSLLESIAGFAIIEKATMSKTANLRHQSDVDELWDSMCQSAINLITKNLHTVENDELLLRIKGRVALFMLTMEKWGYSVAAMNDLLLTLFSKYSELLKQRFSDDFLEIVTTDDYMPMPINSVEEYDKVVTVSWYSPDKTREELTFPCVLPFSQMYPLCCIDIRNFLNQIYLFSDDYFQKSSIIDETLRTALDDLLCQKVCQALIERLSSQYPGQIVQILTNLEHFEVACVELQDLLFQARSSPSATGPIILEATERFKLAKKQASDRIFELVNSKIDDLIETAEYDWMATKPAAEPSEYMLELTRYLSNIMSSVLLALPTDIKEFIYFDALSHASTAILDLTLDEGVKRITPSAVADLATDTRYLSDFVSSLNNPILMENLDELTQTVALMGTENSDEFFDVAQRNRKYGKVDNMKGAILLEKVQEGAQVAAQSPTKPSTTSERFGTLGSRFNFR
ncbi:exocyst complex component SEC15 [Parastagonospora nodorum]|uniref:Exocyst complex component SEC15 n=1 Tax=Phaeosphaeria nodorum (strain SN15 / ATCC MYA-4574 / FGSC 10173) TaxID=321614 RepID=A0A7U2FAQ2_PHANO|nr:exocyst complex component SEC15 [Parastagonospora nodorum]QRD00789.1 exocyst complex component SEC15 [Parastagonospora nodorum SN15]KAH3925841.1 exocyst complex component SEC15 [Parastagonospora nodorum]KAH3952843.1 exocyst complex component SEC15 [Parastagonospora nodorum]KAH3984550.1 exocyst complex component SEC15 [Parastagonospora nodorum]